MKLHQALFAAAFLLMALWIADLLAEVHDYRAMSPAGTAEGGRR